MSDLLRKSLGKVPYEWTGMKTLLLKAPASLQTQQKTELTQLVAELDEPGPDGISTRCIIESQAFFVQQRVHRPGVTADSIGQLLATAPTLEYRLGYDLCRFYIKGPAAFALFPMLASLSLCCVRPAKAFSQLLESVAEDQELLEAAMHGRPDMVLQRPLPYSKDDHIGDASSVYHGNNPLVITHPVYTPAVRQLGETLKGSWQMLIAFWAFPHVHLRQILDVVSRPILLRSDESGFSTWRWDRNNADAALEPDFELRALAVRAAYDHRLLEAIATEDETSSRFHGLRWLTREDVP
jgi:hypothetical protein